MTSQSSSDSSRETRWFYANANNEPEGPFPLTEIDAMVSAGIAPADPLVIEEGGADWRNLSTIVPASFPTQPPPIPSQPGEVGNLAAKKPTGKGMSIGCLPFAGIIIGSVTVICIIAVILDDVSGGRVSSAIGQQSAQTISDQTSERYFDIDPERFRLAFNRKAEELKLANRFHINEILAETGESRDTFTIKFSGDMSLLGSIDKPSQKILDLTVVAKGGNAESATNLILLPIVAMATMDTSTSAEKRRDAALRLLDRAFASPDTHQLADEGYLRLDATILKESGKMTFRVSLPPQNAIAQVTPKPASESVSEPTSTPPYIVLSKDKMPLEHTLALLNANKGSLPSDDVTVDRFRYLLAQDSHKTGETREKIADIASRYQGVANSRGVSLSLLELMEKVHRVIECVRYSSNVVRRCSPFDCSAGHAIGRF